MKPTLRTTTLTLKPSTDEMTMPGDYYIVERLGSTDTNVRPHPAIILKCPFCGGDMASTGIHRIVKRNAVICFLRRLCGYPRSVTITPMLQCPYNPSHKFEIKNGKFIAK